MAQDIIALDSQIFKSYVACKRMAKFQFIDKLEPLTKESYFDRGDLVHVMLAKHYTLVMQNHTHHTHANIPYDQIINETVMLGNQHSAKLDLAVEECIRAIEVYKEYAEYYRGENWVPTHVETAFSVPLFESEELLILWEGKIDLMVQHGIVDTKSSERRGEPNSLDDQFLGYCYAMQCNNLIINKIGFQKTLKPEAKFERYTKSYPKAIIEEWRQHVVKVVQEGLLADVKAALPGKLEGEMYKSFNYTACQKWGCRYYPICGTEPEIREWKIRQTYKIGAEWSPAKKLEEQKVTS